MTVLVMIVCPAIHHPQVITIITNVRGATPRRGGERMKRVTLTIARILAPPVTVAHQVTGPASARTATALAAGALKKWNLITPA